MTRILLVVALTASALLAGGRARSEPPSPSEQIRALAMSSDWAWHALATLTDTIGPRLSGSPQHAAAVVQVAAAMRALGADVTLQPVKVPHWVRGEEDAQLVDYPGRPTGVSQQVHLTALGGSSATPPAGLEARVIVVRNFAELQGRAAEIRGAIVLFAAHFDQRLANNGRAMDAYSQAGTYRFVGPAKAASLGAAAVLVRAVGGANYRLPHTGATLWPEHQAPVPAAAVAAEDADLIDRLAMNGPVKMHLTLTPRTLAEVDTFNVIADWPGSELPKEHVIVSGHLDSWDLGTGATDDGVGVMAAAGVIQVLQLAHLHPRRTIRFIAWANEENGGRGAKAYINSVASNKQNECAAIESDSGAGRALGVVAAVDAHSKPILQPVLDALAPIGATVLELHMGEVGSDIAPLQAAGVAGFAPLVDTQHYFDYHHTAADTLDKVDPINLQTQVATMGVLAYALADSTACLSGVALQDSP